MAGFDSIIDQNRPIRILTTYLRKNAIPHALLFSGIDGVGKTAAALTFAKACNCLAGESRDPSPPGSPNRMSSDAPREALPCDRCRECLRIQSGNHPDVIGIEPQGRQIKIEQIRALYDSLALKPYEARTRFVIISHAEMMNPSASNALLKILEEPPDRTILVLIANQPSNLLPTIVSRCQHIRFNPISRVHIRDILVDTEGLADNHAAVIASLAKGSLQRATSLSQSDWHQQRNWLLCASGLDQPQTLSTRSPHLLLAFAGRLVKDKEKIGEALESLAIWLRDLLVYRYAPQQVINVDLIDEIQYTASKNTTSALIAKLDIILAAQKEVQRNTNLRLNMELMMLRLARS